MFAWCNCKFSADVYGLGKGRSGKRGAVGDVSLCASAWLARKRSAFGAPILASNRQNGVITSADDL